MDKLYKSDSFYRTVKPEATPTPYLVHKVVREGLSSLADNIDNVSEMLYIHTHTISYIKFVYLIKVNLIF